MNKLLKFSILVGIFVSLAGCESDDHAAALIKSPVISDVGMFNDCAVKFVNRGYNDLSFYIAKCDTTGTTTRNYTERQGKATVSRRQTVITKEIEALQAEKEIVLAKELALSKLTPEEKKSLGL